MFSKLKQFKDLREQGKKLQDLIGDESVTVDKMGGKVVLTMNGNLAIVGLAIDPSVLNADNKSKLEEAIKDAHSDALKKMQRTIAMKMQQSGDFNMPGLN
jgi:DNA-binding protein YbaB